MSSANYKHYGHYGHYPRALNIISGPNDNNFIPTFKLTVVGTAQAGKTSIIQRFTKNVFSSMTETTIGASFISQNIISTNGTPIKLNIWDTAGQERYHSLVPMYLRKSDIILIIYDLTEMNSYKDVTYWYKTCLNVIQPSTSIYIIANKNDTSAKQKYSVQEGKTFASQHHLPFYVVSAKTCENIHTLFTDITDDLVLVNVNDNVNGHDSNVNGQNHSSPTYLQLDGIQKYKYNRNCKGRCSII